MGFGGLDADEEKRGDIPGGFAFGDELQDLAFAEREGIGLVVGLCFVRSEDGSGDIRTVINLSGRDLVDSVNEVARGL